MERRTFLGLLGTVVWGTFLLKNEPPPSAPSANLSLNRWNPHPKQVEFLNRPDASLFGVPYHHSNASTGQWLGFARR